MRLKTSQLGTHLQQQLATLYVVTGDEPLQQMESCDAIRAAARANDYSSREIIEAGARFDWHLLGAEADSLSLFAEKKIIDLRIPTGKPGREGGAALAAYCQRPPEDTLLLITLPKLDQSQQRSKWFTTLEKSGVVIQIWPIKDRELNQWIQQRMQASGLQPEPGVVEMLAERIEGNLLAARQEIEKLLLTTGPGKVSQQLLAESVADSARYDVFGLIDSALNGEGRHCARMLAGIQAEGIAAPLVLWVLAREIRSLCQMSYAVQKGQSPDQAMSKIKPPIWNNRKAIVRKALSRHPYAAYQRLLQQCHQADASIKGVAPQDPWLRMTDITLELCGNTVIG